MSGNFYILYTVSNRGKKPSYQSDTPGLEPGWTALRGTGLHWVLMPQSYRLEVAALCHEQSFSVWKEERTLSLKKHHSTNSDHSFFVSECLSATAEFLTCHYRKPLWCIRRNSIQKRLLCITFSPYLFPSLAANNLIQISPTPNSRLSGPSILLKQARSSGSVMSASSRFMKFQSNYSPQTQ